VPFADAGGTDPVLFRQQTPTPFAAQAIEPGVDLKGLALAPLLEAAGDFGKPDRLGARVLNDERPLALRSTALELQPTAAN
jgi:hypothetical protein